MRIITIASFLIFSCVAYAQDSCYVYTQLHWEPTLSGYVAKIQLNDEGKDVDITDENGKKLTFKSFLHALNYLSTKGWEYVEDSPIRVDEALWLKSKERIALIRKRMSVEEAKKYATPD